jgi:hypothetical protein
MRSFVCVKSSVDLCPEHRDLFAMTMRTGALPFRFKPGEEREGVEEEGEREEKEGRGREKEDEEREEGVEEEREVEITRRDKVISPPSLPSLPSLPYHALISFTLSTPT